MIRFNEDRIHNKDDVVACAFVTLSGAQSHIFALTRSPEVKLNEI